MRICQVMVYLLLHSTFCVLLFAFYYNELLLNLCSDSGMFPSDISDEESRQVCYIYGAVLNFS